MANRDEILRQLIVELITNPQAGQEISIGDVLKYDDSFAFTDPRHIPDLAYVQFLLTSYTSKNEVSGDQNDILSYTVGSNTQGRINTPYLVVNTIFTASFTLSGETFYLSAQMLQGGYLYGFPDPSTNNFTFNITYI